MNKKGQAYLIASLIIISMIIAFATVSNYSNRTGYVKIYNLEYDYRIETEKIVDYSLINGVDSKSLIRNFTKDFSIYSGEDIIIYTIFGQGYDTENIRAYQYTNGVETYLNFDISSENIIVGVDGVDYKFKLISGENFYYIISQKRGDEKYVITG